MILIFQMRKAGQKGSKCLSKAKEEAHVQVRICGFELFSLLH